MATIIVKDAFRTSVEAATGGLCTVLYDDAGLPSVMRVFPKCNIEDVAPDLGLTGTHPAFIVNGVEKSEIFIGVYQASMAGDKAVSMPGCKVANNYTFTQCETFSKNKGQGWHMMSNAEWSLIQALALKNEFQPNGNTSYGRNYTYKHEVGTLESRSYIAGDQASGARRILSGSGPLSWRHDGTTAGIADLVGNVSEWTTGVRLVDGEIQVIPNNDAASYTADTSSTSSEWKAFLQDGSLVAPGTADTLKYDATGTNGGGQPKISTEITSQYVSGDTQASVAFKSMTAEDGITVPSNLKLFGLYPYDTVNSTGSFYTRNKNEMICLRGGSYGNGSNAGLWCTLLVYSRSIPAGVVGFRVAFI